MTRPGLMVIVGELLSRSSQLIIVGAGTVLLRTGIYSAKHEELLKTLCGCEGSLFCGLPSEP